MPAELFPAFSQLKSSADKQHALVYRNSPKGLFHFLPPREVHRAKLVLQFMRNTVNLPIKSTSVAASSEKFITCVWTHNLAQ